MVRGKHAGAAAPTKQSGKKLIVLVAGLALLLGVGIGGTVAYLMDKTAPVVNTFTYGDINITLEETDTEMDGDGDPNTNQYEMMPGLSIAKDPVVTVKAGSKDCWLFVRLEKSDNFDDFLTYTPAAGWTQLVDAEDEPVEGVFYRPVKEDDVGEEDLEFSILLDNEVTVKEEVTKDELNALDEADPPAYPTLSITAYAVQRSEELDAVDDPLGAWELASQSQTGETEGAQPDAGEDTGGE